MQVVAYREEKDDPMKLGLVMSVFRGQVVKPQPKAKAKAKAGAKAVAAPPQPQTRGQKRGAAPHPFAIPARICTGVDIRQLKVGNEPPRAGPVWDLVRGRAGAGPGNSGNASPGRGGGIFRNHFEQIPPAPPPAAPPGALRAPGKGDFSK